MADLRNENVIWLVYGNRDFKPCCGTVIQIIENAYYNGNNYH